MPGDLPKVAHPTCGRPMVRWVVEACRDAGCGRLVLIVGYKQEIVRGMFEGERGVEFVEQREQHGTGHAVACAAEAFRGWKGDVLVLAGDSPLVTARTLRSLADLRRRTGADAALATSTMDDPTGYGRIVRDGAGRFSAIVEEKNGSAEQKRIREVYFSLACFDAPALFGALARLERDALSGEYYITHVPEMLAHEGRRVELLAGVSPEEAFGVNTPDQLAHAESLMRGRMSVAGATAGRAAAS